MAEPLQFAPDDLPLRDDIRALGASLGEVLQVQGGQTLFERVERIRTTARRRRTGDASDADLSAALVDLSPRSAGLVIRAFSTLSALTSVAERIHRLRVRRATELNDSPPPAGSFEAALRLLSKRYSVPELQRLIDRLCVTPCLTAHPTEATRRTVLTKELRISETLLDRVRMGRLTPSEDRTLGRRVQRQIAITWQTEEHLTERPTVADEVEHALFYLVRGIAPSLTLLQESFDQAVARVYGYRALTLRDPIVRVASWVGGDMDGNPNVGPDTIRDTLKRHRDQALTLWRTDVRALFTELSQSTSRVPVEPAVLETIARYRILLPEAAAAIPRRYGDMPYRVLLWLMWARLGGVDAQGHGRGASRATVPPEPLARAEASSEVPDADPTEVPGTTAVDPAAPSPEGTLLPDRIAAAPAGIPALEASQLYPGPAPFLDDLKLIADSLRLNRGQRAGLRLVERLISQVETFGFHLATLDVRQDSLNHRQALDDLAEALGEGTFSATTPELRAQRLAAWVQAPPPLPATPLSPRLVKTLAVFDAIREAQATYGPAASQLFIISMAHEPSDALAVLALARVAAFRAGLQASTAVSLDIAPLFETVDDLARAAATMEALWSNPTYRAHLKSRGDEQVLMIGYSDSNKDAGIVASRWGLQEAQASLARLSDKNRIKITLFHGRGGTVSRGGGSPRAGVLAAPPSAVRGRLRVTEQGEIVHNKYGLPSLAAATLETMAASVLEAAALEQAAPDRASASTRDPASALAFTTFANAARKAYRALIDAPGFMEYFRLSTPIDVIERMPLGSRPARRRSGTLSIGDLRAIPWVFSWTQSRQIITGWFGVGSGLEALIAQEGLPAVRALLDEPFFAALLSDVEMVLTKVDLNIAARYAALAGPKGAPHFAAIQAEYERTRAAILAVRDTPELLAHEPELARTLRLRDPYIDPVSLLQVDLLERWRATATPDPELEEVLIASVIGVARGLQNTG